MSRQTVTDAAAPSRRSRLASRAVLPLLVAGGVLLALIAGGSRFGALRASGVTYARFVEDFDDGVLPKAPHLVASAGFSACRWGLCLAPGASGRLVLDYPLPPRPQVVLRLWHYAALPRITNRLAVSLDEGRTWNEVSRGRHLQATVVDLDALLAGSSASRLWLELGGTNRSDHEALLLDRMDLVVSNAPRPSDLPYLSALFRLALVPLCLAVSLAPWLGPGRAGLVGLLVASGVAGASTWLPGGLWILGRSTWAVLAAALALAAGHAALHRHAPAAGRPGLLAAVLVVSWALALRWGEFLIAYRFPIMDDALGYLNFMRRFAWGSPTSGFYSYGFGPREPMFLSLGATFFALVGASDLALRLLTLLLSVTAVWLTYALGRRVFESALVGLLGAWLVAGSPYLLFEAVRGFRGDLETCLVLLLAWSAWQSVGPLAWGRLLLAGLLAGALCLTRLPYFPGALVLLAWAAWRGAGWRRGWPRGAAAAAVMLLLVSPFLAAATVREGRPFATNRAHFRGFLTKARAALDLEPAPATKAETMPQLATEAWTVFGKAGGVQVIAEGYRLALRDVAVLGARRGYWVALAGLGLLALTRRRFFVGMLLLSISHVAPFYAVASKPIPDPVAFATSPDVYHGFYGGGLFGFGIHDRFRTLAQGAPFAALAAGWLGVAATRRLGRAIQLGRRRRAPEDAWPAMASPPSPSASAP